MNGPGTDELQERLRRSLRTVAHATAVPPRPELVLPRGRSRAGLRSLAIAAAIVAILGVVAFAQLLGGLNRADPSRPLPSGGDPFPAVERLVSVEHPDEAKAEMERAFRELDLDVTMRLVPVEPERAGKVLGVEGGIQAENEDCFPGVPGCRILVTVPEGFDGHGVVVVGTGEPEPDEDDQLYADEREPEYSVPRDAFAVGQPLHCHPDLLGLAIEPAMRRISELELEGRQEFHGEAAEAGAPLFVRSARMLSPDVVVLETQATPYQPPASRLSSAAGGC
jgi:hypothetical protein